VSWRVISNLRPFSTNARTHSPKQISQIVASIKAFGFTNPVIVDDQDRILAGHGRVDAARLLGLKAVPTVQLSHLSEAQKRAYVLADNRLAELAGWDKEILKLELQHLVDIDFDVELTGFSTAEIDLLIDGAPGDAAPDPADRVPDIDPNAANVTRVGDLWELGKHRLLCADATESSSYAKLLGAARAEMVFTDPPYNVPIEGHVGGHGAVRHKDFVMASGEMSRGEFTSFLTTVFEALVDHTSDGSIHFVCMDWRHCQEIITAGQRAYTELKNLCVWNKDNAGMGAFYRSKHELIFVFKKGREAHINNFGLGEKGRYRTNVWDYAGVNTLKRGRTEELAMHPTVKPVAMVADAIRDCSRRNGIILDPFCGSGTTIVAAERTGRCAYALELDPKYVDVAVRRWEALTGAKAIRREGRPSGQGAIATKVMAAEGEHDEQAL
jgi:DNA modification methylase